MYISYLTRRGARLQNLHAFDWLLEVFPSPSVPVCVSFRPLLVRHSRSRGPAVHGACCTFILSLPSYLPPFPWTTLSISQPLPFLQYNSLRPLAPLGLANERQVRKFPSLGLIAQGLC